MEGKLEQVGRGVFAGIGVEGATNFGIIKGDDDTALLIDADIRRIDEVQDALEKTGCKRIRYLFITHEHFDHASSNQYFAKTGIPILSSEACREALKEDGQEQFDRMTKQAPELIKRFPNLEVVCPHITFADTSTIHLPGVTVNLGYRAHNGHSHSKGDSTAFVEGEKILFAGDLLYTEVHPVTFFGNIPNWLLSLQRLQNVSFGKVVPGHGPVGEGEREGKKYFRKLYSYLEDLYEQLCEAKAGRKTPEQVASHMTSGAYASLGKVRMVKRNIDQFLTGDWYS